MQSVRRNGIMWEAIHRTDTYNTALQRQMSRATSSLHLGTGMHDVIIDIWGKGRLLTSSTQAWAMRPS